MILRGAYRQALLDEHDALVRLRTMLLSGWLFTVLLAGVMFAFAVIYLLTGTQ